MDTNPGILDDNCTHHRKAWLTAVAVVPRIAIQRIGVPRIGSVFCFLVPWVIIRIEMKNEKCRVII